MKTFLIVDDSKLMRMVAREIIQKFEFDIREAADGQLALDACLESMPDGILLDWNMPVMDGITFLRALRKVPNGDKPIVMFCTTENDLEFIQEGIDAGASEHIMKPFDLETITAKFKQVKLL